MTFHWQDIPRILQRRPFDGVAEGRPINFLGDLLYAIGMAAFLVIAAIFVAQTTIAVVLACFVIGVLVAIASAFLSPGVSTLRLISLASGIAIVLGFGAYLRGEFINLRQVAERNSVAQKALQAEVIKLRYAEEQSAATIRTMRTALEQSISAQKTSQAAVTALQQTNPKKNARSKAAPAKAAKAPPPFRGKKKRR